MLEAERYITDKKAELKEARREIVNLFEVVKR